MNKKISLILVSGLLLAVMGAAQPMIAAAQTQGSPNLVPNASFEVAGSRGIGDALDWQEGTNHQRANDKFVTGNWSLKSTFTSLGGMTTRTTIAVAPDTSYVLSGYIWNDATNVGHRACLDMNDLQGELQLCATTIGQWQFVKGSWASGSTTSLTLRLLTDGSPNAGSWFDDISLVAQAPTSGPTSTLSSTARPSPTLSSTPASLSSPVPRFSLTPTPSPTLTVLPTRTLTSTPRPTRTLTPTATVGPDGFTVVAAGDIACGTNSTDIGVICQQQATYNLLLSLRPYKILALGDNQYERGSLGDFGKFFSPTWGRLKDKISPITGNHEYFTSGAVGYFDYFNGRGNPTGPAGDRDKGYYSYNLGNWHFIALNSNCDKIGGCGQGSPEYTWLKNDLTTDTHLCTLMYMHHPLSASDKRTYDVEPPYQPLYQLFYRDGGDLVLVGHSHFYERFARMDSQKHLDSAYGFRQIIVGTGGRSGQLFGTIRPHSEVHTGNIFGVIKLSLRQNDYSWEFVPIPGYTFTDSGTDTCHGPHP